MGIVIFICLLTGPHTKWVKRFLPNTANRVIFVVIVTGMVAAWIVQGTELINHAKGGEQYFPFACAILCGGALYRFVHVWWVRPEKPAVL
jgi:hypothetical protein